MHIYCSNCGSKNDYASAMKTKVCAKCEKPMLKPTPSKAKASFSFDESCEKREFGDTLPQINKLNVDIQVIKPKKITLASLIPPPDAKA